jgi:hypothetical protein
VSSHNDKKGKSIRAGRKEDESKLKTLRMKLEAGIDALDRGDFIEIDVADLGSYSRT